MKEAVTTRQSFFSSQGEPLGLFAQLQGKTLFFVGIKGTGMSSLACLLSAAGIRVAGSDVPVRFATDDMLAAADIGPVSDFSVESMPMDIDMLIHSAAYDPHTHPQIMHACSRGIRVYSYPAWLAWMSARMRSYGVAGTHGKTTATGCVDWMLRHTDIPCMALYGSHVQGEKRSFRGTGDEVGIFEACEYRDHFLSYDLQGLLITTIEHDHPDWFSDEAQVFESFKRLVLRLPDGAPVVCGIDSIASRRLAAWITSACPSVHLITYGTAGESMFRLTEHVADSSGSSFRLTPWGRTYHSRFASVPLCLDVVGAALLGAALINRWEQRDDSAKALSEGHVVPALLAEAEDFPGCAGRVELLFEEDGVAYVDDYAHHPAEIDASMEDVRSRYPDRRIITIFFPHTRSRTEAFYRRFVESLSLSDLLVVRPIFASARDDGDAKEHQLAMNLAKEAGGLFIADEQELVDRVAALLHPSDVCVTMGAGNNNGLARKIAERRRCGICWA